MADGSWPLLTALRALLFVAAAIVAPGVALQRLARVRVLPALVVPLGLVHCALAYWLALVLGQPLLFPLLTAASVVSALVRRRRAARGTTVAPDASGAPRESWPSLRGALVPIGLLVALFAITQYRTNRVARSGAFLLDVGEHVDTALHVGLSFELVAGYPPQVPGFAGVPLHYHVASHLVRAAAARWAGIHPYDSMNRFDITLWAVALVLVLRAVASAAGLGRAAVAVAGFVPLLSDLSFVPGLALGAQWWAQRLGSNFLEPVFFANSIAPALALALGAIVALTCAERGEGRGWLAIAVILAVGACFFKVFTGAELVLALGIAWLLGRSRSLLVVLVPAVLALAALALGSGAEAGAPGVSVELVPFAAAAPALAAFGLSGLRGAAFALGCLSWLALSLGLRVFGVPAAWRALRSGAARSGGAATLAALALCGWPLAMMLRIAADPGFDESTYFMQASGVVLWLFAVPALSALYRRSAVLAVAIVALLAAPSTLEFVGRKAAQQGQPIPKAAVAAMSELRRASCPGDVVITRPLPSFVPLPVVLAGRRVAFSNYLSYWQQFVSTETLDERSRLVRSFFRARTPEQALEVARALDGRYLYLTGRQKVDFETSGVLEPLFDADGERVYRIVPLARESCAHGRVQGR